MKTPTVLSVMFAAAISVTATNSISVVDQQPQISDDVYACGWFPLCTDPDIYSPSTTDEKDQSATSDGDISAKLV